MTRVSWRGFAARALRPLGIELVDLRPEPLVRAARRRTGLDDFAEDGFREPFGVFARSLDDEAALPHRGRVAVRRKLLELLSRRLHVQHDVGRFPEIEAQRLRRPIVVVAMPRSGTTLLNGLLLQHPGCRWLRPWEIEEPWPDPSEALPEERDPRLRRHRAWLERERATGSGMNRIHALDAPAECNDLFLATFVCSRLALMADTPSYDRWLETAESAHWTVAYRHYATQLRRLQLRKPGTHWVLKSVTHLRHLDSLLEVLPDACVVQLHRDPRKVVASTASMHATVRGELIDDVDPREVGGGVMARLARSAGIACQARDRLDGRRFCDVLYPELVADPVGTVRRIYRSFDLEWPEDMDSRLESWLAENRQHKWGVHRYSLEQFGLDAAAVDLAFEPYVARFGVLRETAA